jgi:uncharacterized protein
MLSIALKFKRMNPELIRESLDTNGYALISSLLSFNTCENLIAAYTDAAQYRKTIDMQRYRFGKGEYKYFQYPLPEVIQKLRSELYVPLSHIANEWASHLNSGLSYPDNHTKFLEMCKQKNQTRPTPLILRYETGGYNTLHQDLYGEIFFPFQVVIILNQTGVDFTGGEFVMTEQIPRAQSKVMVIQPNMGDAVVFTTHSRPIKGSRGYYRANMKHGISEVKSGERYGLGVIFHDAA